jgi:hypothetical protein
LMWQQGGSSEEYMKYKDAKKWIEELKQKGYAVFHDWRLPTLEEAMSLIEPEQKHGVLYIDPVFDAKQRRIWTADHWKTVQLRAYSLAWIVSFDGFCYRDYFDASNSGRAVRSEQSSKE